MPGGRWSTRNISRAPAGVQLRGRPRQYFGDTATPNADDPAERDSLWRALRPPPIRQRTVLVLRFYEDATDADIAAVLDCRRGTVRSLVSRGLATLRADPTLDFTTSEGGAR